MERRQLLAITVDALVDEADGSIVDGDVSLRDAIALAPAGETINFSVNGTIDLTLGEITIDKDLTIDGPGAGNLTIDAGDGADNTPNTGDGHRIFRIDNGNSNNEIVVEISGLTLTGGDETEDNSFDGGGGAIHNRENLTLIESTLIGNAASDGFREAGGGIWNTGTLMVVNSTISGNSATRAGAIYNRGSAVVSSSTITANGANYDGGGIKNTSQFGADSGTLTITDSVISGNSADSGGGVRNTSEYGAVSIIGSTIDGNTATSGGGLQNNYGTLNVTNSTISGNSASRGGGIENNYQGTLNISNSTLSGNTATSQGGGIDNGLSDVPAGTINIANSTITGNTAASGGGIQNDGVDDSGMVILSHTIVSGNSAGSGSEILNNNVVAVNGYNLLGDNSRNTAAALVNVTPGATDIVASSDGTLPTALADIIDALADNGGSTLTHALATGSPAINAGDPTFVGPPDSDQRGAPFVRRFGGTVDIGAIESHGDLFVVDTLDDESDGNVSPSDLSLREALELANAAPRFNSISFDSNLAGGTINLTLGELEITDDVSIVGLGADQLTIDAGGNSRVINVGVNTTANISGLTITGGNADGAGGGGIRTAGNTNATITAAVISGNAATQNGNFGGIGGGVQAYGTLTISDSTISGNSADADGGGIWISNDFFTPGGSDVARITNSTISGNTAGDDGGGVYASYGRTIIRHSTITGNTASTGDGVASFNDFFAYNRTEIHSTIIAGNTGNDDVTTSGPGNNSIRSDGYNLVGNGSAAGAFVEAGDQNGVTNPMLGPLSDNGGPTETHDLLAGSPAIGAGDPAAATGVSGVPLFDQRGDGFERVSGGSIDIGAIEVQVLLPDSADFDGDGNTNGRDFLSWQSGFGTMAPNAVKADGDADNDLDVDGDDLGIWELQFGTAAPAVAFASSLDGESPAEAGISPSAESAYSAGNLIDAAIAHWLQEGAGADTAGTQEKLELPDPDATVRLSVIDAAYDDGLKVDQAGERQAPAAARSGDLAPAVDGLDEELLASVFS